MIRLTAIFADAAVPEAPVLNLDTLRQTNGPFPTAFVALAAFALLLVGYLVWDFWRQKRTERLQRRRLENFRAKKFKESSGTPVLKARQDDLHR
jgi:hypothetical protein